MREYIKLIFLYPFAVIYTLTLWTINAAIDAWKDLRNGE